MKSMGLVLGSLNLGMYLSSWHAVNLAVAIGNFGMAFLWYRWPDGVPWFKKKTRDQSGFPL